MRDDLEITKQDAINILRHCSATAPDLNRCDTCIAARRCDEYFAAIAKLLENGTCGWIPVTERLPQPLRRVIVCREDGVVEQGHKDVGDWWKVYGTRTKKITHWMPLPIAPAEQEETV